LKDADPAVALFAATALPRIVKGKPLRDALRDRDKTVRRAAAILLEGVEADAPQAARSLQRALKEDEDAAVRAAAATALGGLGADALPARKALTAALKDRDWGVRLAAGEALRSLDPEAARAAGVR
jgi:HEAT repeat protein